MSGRIFQNVVLQFKETTDRTIGVIDAEGTVIACSELTGIGKRWPNLVEPINEAEGACIALEGKTFKALAGWGGHLSTMPRSPAARTRISRRSAPWRPWRSTPPRAIMRRSTTRVLRQEHHLRQHSAQ